MSLLAKVPQLHTTKIFRGSAWFVDSIHALTALHCVADEDGDIFEQITLTFLDQIPIAVEVVETFASLDIAVLRLLDPTTPIFDKTVITARRNCSSGASCRLYGHPGVVGKVSPGGIVVTGQVIDSAQVYLGTTGKLKFHAISVSHLSVGPDANGQTNLEGISGGLLAYSGGKGEVSLGVIVEEGMNGNYIYAVPLSEIASQSAIVYKAWESTSDEYSDDKRLYVDLTDDGRELKWSSLTPPQLVGEMWIDNDEVRATEVFCGVGLARLGAAGKALLRLIAYSHTKMVNVPDNTEWRRRVDELTDTHMRPDADVTLSKITSIDSLAHTLPPAPWLVKPLDEVAELIHSALDLQLLQYLHDEMYACLDGTKDPDIGVPLDQNLKAEMWTHWRDWEETLRTDRKLLRRFLLRIFTLDADSKESGSNYSGLGSSKLGNRQIFHATLLGLALRAADVAVLPSSANSGNLLIEKQLGHACGVVQQGGKRLSLFAGTLDWKTEVVILPYMHHSILAQFEKAIPMTSTSGTLGIPIPKMPPVAITADDDFLIALSKGRTEVRAYYDRKVDELKTLRDTWTLSPRTGPLDA